MGERLDKTLIDDRLRDFTSEDSGVEDSRIPTEGNRFESRGTVAKGGMGAIIDVFDHHMQRQVAMKVLHDDLLSRQGELETFIREAAGEG